MKRFLFILSFLIAILTTCIPICAIDISEKDVSTVTKMEIVDDTELPFTFLSIFFGDSTDFIGIGYKWKSGYSESNVTLKIFERTTDGESEEEVRPDEGIFTLSTENSYTFYCSVKRNKSTYNYGGDLIVGISGGNTYVYPKNIICVSKKSVSAAQINASSGTKTEIEPNDTYSNATPAYDGYDCYGTISSQSDVDWWQIVFSRSGYANFWLGNIPNGRNYDIDLYNSNLALIATSRRTSNTDELISMYENTPGTYYLKVYSRSGAAPSDQYHLRIKWYPFTPKKVYTVRNVATGSYITVKGGYNSSVISYAPTIVSTSSAENGQRMRLTYNQESDYYLISPICSYNGRYRVLNVYGGLSSSDRRIFCYTDRTASDGQFAFKKNADNSYVICMKSNSNYVLDVSNGYVCVNIQNGSPTQRWYLEYDTEYNEAEELYKSYNLSWPLAGSSSLTSSYGYRTLDGGTSTQFHNGLDISATNRTSVFCPTNAKSVKYGYYKDCGYYHVLETNNNVYGSSTKIRLLFQHLCESPANTISGLTYGTVFSTGDLIARTGDTGSAGSYHLHYTVVTDGSDVFIGSGYSTRNFENTTNPLSFYPNTRFKSFY